MVFQQPAARLRPTQNSTRFWLMPCSTSKSLDHFTHVGPSLTAVGFGVSPATRSKSRTTQNMGMGVMVKGVAEEVVSLFLKVLFHCLWVWKYTTGACECVYGPVVGPSHCNKPVGFLGSLDWTGLWIAQITTQNMGVMI